MDSQAKLTEVQPDCVRTSAAGGGKFWNLIREALATIPFENLALLAVIVGCSMFYRFLAETTNYAAHERAWKGGGYYALLADGFLKGQLHLPITIDPGLAKLANPYDATKNQRFRLTDGSYFEGKYYLYFGVSPVVPFVVWKALTGKALRDQTMVALYMTGGLLLAVVTLLTVRQQWFPRASSYSVIIAALTLGLASGTLVLARRPLVWEVAISGAYFFCMGSVFCLLQAIVTQTGRRFVYLGLCGLCFGLTVAARANFAISSLAWVGGLGWWLWRCRELTVRERVLSFGSWLAPVVAVALGLMAYNHARFRNPLEFGNRYQTTGITADGRALTNDQLFSMRLENVPINLWFSLLGPHNWKQDFPYVHYRGWGRNSTDVPPYLLHTRYLFTEWSPGALSINPFLWWLLMVPILIPMLRPHAVRRDLGAFSLIVWANGGIALLVSCAAFPAISIRYQADVLPSWVLVACIGFFAADQALRGAVVRRIWLCIVSTVLAAYGWLASAAPMFEPGFVTPDEFKRIKSQFGEIPKRWDVGPLIPK